MRKLTHADLMKLEDYAHERSEFRARVLAHKHNRRIHLGAHFTLIFEDRLTVHYQVQEMLRIERIFEPTAIAEELDTYNPLIPDGANLKATLLIEYGDVEVRKRALQQLRGVENLIALEVSGQTPVFAIADEDLERSNAIKTSAVHFLRFELTPAMVSALRGAAAMSFAVDHPHYRAAITLAEPAREALIADLD